MTEGVIAGGTLAAGIIASFGVGGAVSNYFYENSQLYGNAMDTMWGEQHWSRDRAEANGDLAVPTSADLRRRMGVKEDQ